MSHPIFDFTITPELRCHHCGYSLQGLLPTRRCPECGSLIVESLFCAGVRSEQRAASSRQRAFELAFLRQEWRPAIGMAVAGVLMGLAATLLALGRGQAPAAALIAVPLAGVGSLAIGAGLLLCERIGLLGLPSPRAAWALALCVNLFAAGAVAALSMILGSAGALLLQLPLATLALALAVHRSVPHLTPVLALVAVCTCFTCLLLIAAIALA